MIHHYFGQELQEQLRRMVIIADTREQRGEHIEHYLQTNNVNLIKRKLDIGDYSAQLGDDSYERDFTIERKGSIDELAGNLSKDRDRFEREFLRAKAYGTKVFLIIENGSWHDIIAHNYESQISADALLASLLSWQVRFNITIIFCRREESPKIILKTLSYAVREALLYGWRYYH